ncbi:MAG: cation transporter [Planctomycetes bacterium]|nr:cation transporter [Planctomycetota bacterium]
MAIFKIFVGTVSGSQGLVADGMHSGSDVLATIMVIISLRISGRDDDEKHPWGYGKIEFLGALMVYVVLFILSLYLLYEAVTKIASGQITPPAMISAIAAAMSILTNYILSGYGFCAGKQLSSPAMIANANENKADMLSSFAVIVGIVGANMGFAAMDSLAAVVVALIIMKTALELGLEALRNLLDASLEPEKIELLQEHVLECRGVKGVRYIKARRVGQSVWLNITVLVDEKLPITEAHEITRQVRLMLIRHFRHIKDISIAFSCK